MKKPLVFIIFMLCVVLALTIAQIAVSNSLSISGITLSNLETQMKQYEKENMLLEEKVLTLSSLTHIASVSAQLGFVKETTPLYLGDQLPIAVKQ